MKTPRSTACKFVFAALLMISSLVRAEDISVHECVMVGEDGDVSVGKELAVFKTGVKSLMTICQDSEKPSGKSGPLHGLVMPYIFKDTSGQLFIVHFEFLAGHPVLGKGSRFAIKMLEAKPGVKDVYTGSPNDASIVTDEGLLEQLRALAVKP